ncbi:hypothetical protein Tco_0395289, partial [Tanacetum coccineum]
TWFNRKWINELGQCYAHIPLIENEYYDIEMSAEKIKSISDTTDNGDDVDMDVEHNMDDLFPIDEDDDDETELHQWYR